MIGLLILQSEFKSRDSKCTTGRIDWKRLPRLGWKPARGCFQHCGNRHCIVIPTGTGMTVQQNDQACDRQANHP
jgi:hypothetical protein